MSDFVTSVIINLKGNFERQSRAYAKANESFVKTSNRNLRSLNNSYVKHSEVATRFGRNFGLLATGFVGTKAASAVMDFDASLVQLQTDGKATVEQITKLKRELTDLANDPRIRLSKEQLLTGFQTIVSDTGDVESAQKNLPNLGLLMRANNLDAQSAGHLISIAFLAGIKDAEGVGNFVSGVSDQGKIGSAPLSVSGTLVKAIYAPAVSKIGADQDTLMDTGAVFQMINNAIRSPDSAATALNTLQSELLDPEKNKKLKAVGIDVFRPGTNKLRHLSDIIAEIFTKSGGDISKIGTVFGAGSIEAFSAYGMPGAPEQLRAMINAKADLKMMEDDARINALTAKSAWQSIKNNVTETSDTLLSTPLKVIANELDKGSQARKRNRSLSFFEEIQAEFTTPTKKPENASQAPFSGEVKITIDQDGRAKVKKVTSNNKDVNIAVDNGIQVGSP